MKQHPLDPISLVFGGVLTAVGLFLVSSDARWESAGSVWVLPGLLVVVGAAILWSTVRQLRSSTHDEAEPDDDDLESEEYALPDLPGPLSD